MKNIFLLNKFRDAISGQAVKGQGLDINTGSK
jgi:hypothetical protein